MAFILVYTSFGAFAQLTEPGGTPGDPESNHTPVGGSAPMGNGIAILIMLGAAYSYRKIVKLELEEV